MRLSVIVVNWNSRADLDACLRSLRAQTHPDVEVIVVDNGSTDGSAEMVATEFPECILLRQTRNLGFAEACNLGIDAASGPWIALLNNDAVAEAGWAAALVVAADGARPSCGMLQSLMLFSQRPNTINSTGIELTKSGSGVDRWEGQPASAAQSPDEIFCPTGGAAAYRRQMLEEVRLSAGYFDGDHFCYYEDLDLGWRARLAGWTARLVPDAVVHHRYHGSSDRHGRAWLIVTSRTNRIRTLLKNASWTFLLKTSFVTVREVAEIVFHGRSSAGVTLLRATRDSLVHRARVGQIAKQRRADVERAWVSAHT